MSRYFVSTMLRYLLLLHCISIGFTITLNPLSILMVQPLASTSHHVWTMPLLRDLLRKGHHVHIISIHEADVEDKLVQNLTSIVFDDMMSELFKGDDYDPTKWREFSTLQTIQFVYSWGHDMCEKIITTKAAKELLKTVKNVKFDVIVQDVTLNQCLYGLWEVAKDKPPIVGFIPFGLASWFNDYVGGPNYPTVRPHCHVGIAKPEGFWQRTWNAVNYIFDDLIRNYNYFPKAQQLAERYIGHKIRSLHEIQKDISIVLVNSHPAFEPAIPLPPNAIEIGGMHAQSSRTVTDKKIRDFLDGAKNGAVVISLGTNVAWKSVDLDKFKAVVLALSKLKQRVLWKLKIKMSFELPDNIMVVKWIPQGDVLTHKNVKAVWTHGGLLSTQEAIWQGVPIIGMPFFMDQRPNVEILVAKGVCVHLDFETLSTQTILDAFNKVLYNERFVISDPRNPRILLYIKIKIIFELLVNVRLVDPATKDKIGTV
ncbi:UDP-glucuronosyltransferase 2B31-like isoform X2 [Odontomachus brunneus]|uniref:UDP-glucuronosyltransferase 2B31-like isoform X2 n=1 Tax=Odontomachus brunneus TaxID=486640 RepID=UPI0013F28EDC|nr:UDP-glucuronosyltransferase 2B31-like isoform X2 [Odontomachus brunneus]